MARMPKSHAIDALTFGMVILLPMSPPPVIGSPDPDELLRFDELMTALDIGTIQRVGWDELKTTLAKAITHASRGSDNDVAGLKGYCRLLRKWERSANYDGRP